MPPKARTPRTKEEAISKGYNLVTDVQSLCQRLGISPAKLAAQRAQFSADNAVDCSQQPDGTVCYDFEYPNGDHVVGYCQGGQCTLVQGVRGGA